ncbi:type III secretion system chaperone [Paludibacterium yongneupense]|uniref:type III secretion system chaperone n=1 Tax=Paludibacterium yongneupense TaxID=400061 RepID=UPI000404B7EB|nr:type III secretion system chaperone [Paludibacterium yongneupense]
MIEWQEAISQLTGIPTAFDEDGLDSIVDATSGLQIGFHCREGELTLYTQVGVLHDDGRAMQLLAANSFWSQTGGATLSVFDERRIVLSLRLYDKCQPALATHYNRFIAAARRWQTELDAPSDPKAHYPGAMA